MKKLVSAMVSVCVIGMLFVLQSCSNPATSSVGETGNNNGSGSSGYVTMPQGMEDDCLITGGGRPESNQLYSGYNSNSNFYYYEMLLDFCNIYPEQLAAVVLENNDNFDLGVVTLEPFSSNYQPTAQKAQYLLTVKLQANPTSSHIVKFGFKNVTHNVTYGSGMSVTFNIAPVQQN